MTTQTKPAWAVSQTNRPRCPEHGRIMAVESSKGPVGYCYCKQPGCRHSAKVIRKPVAQSQER